ncbi:histidine kinase [Zunongwangia sp. F363]|uniref:Histidine kinase n=1 Tax=Autumnicola tepida TaxID=3075595 RepID=A0ABU3C9S2_9FLAO|nr:histidine kinase [Zunongwangia sp. F363]MDT0643086.1 histidine kinase [Zunongwangia sp. F363]
MRDKVFCILIICTLCFYKLTAQGLNPPIQNFSAVDYDAASQNWDIAIDKDGIIYSANNQGLLSYDGQRWELFPLETGATIRSVYPYKGKIFTGSYREFGYWERDVNGKMHYRSVMSSLGNYPVLSEEFWEILAFDDAIYFRSFGAVYKYEKDSIKPIRRLVANKIAVYKNKLLVAVSQRGLYFLSDDGVLEPLPNQEVLEGKTVLDVMVQGDTLLAGTRDSLYKFDGETFSVYPDYQLNNAIKEYEFNHIMQIAENEVVIGTVKNGIIHYNLKNHKFRVYNRNRGLQNNTVLGMAKKDGKIWLGLDNGIDKMDLDSPIHFFTDESGELGAVYDLTFYNGKLFMASNTGVYTFNNAGDLVIIEGSQGHTWNLEVLDNKLYANHNTGLYTIDNGNFLPVEKRTGSFQITPLPGNNQYLIGTYTGISSYMPAVRGMQQMDSIDFPVKKIVFEDEDVIWAVHPYDGAYRIRLKNNDKESPQVKEVNNIEGLRNSKVDVVTINNNIGILHKNHWYRYNVFRDSLENFRELDAFKNHRLIFNENDKYWFVNLENNSLVYTDFIDVKISIAFKELDQRLVKGNEKMLQVNDSVYYVTLNDGFASINLEKMLREKNQKFVARPILRGIADKNRDYPLNNTPDIPFKSSREITIRAALPASDAAMLHYELEGSSGMGGEVRNGLIKLQNLPHGDYRLKLFALGPQDDIAGSANYSFSINPPWYLSNLMKLVYVFLFLGLIGFLYWFNQLKLNKHQWLLEQKFEEEHRERINEMEKERLRNEITLKRKELANSTMMAAKKNEVLMDIQGELNKDRDKFSNQFRLKHLMNKINTAIKNKDEWQVFETNFNELHEDFFKDLLVKYPKLTNKDLKLCSYLKMNLTSKEIAPLMGISVRGVEVHRYRLRKKMDLDKEENLTNFLIKNF